MFQSCVLEHDCALSDQEGIYKTSWVFVEFMNCLQQIYFSLKDKFLTQGDMMNQYKFQAIYQTVETLLERSAAEA